MKKFQEISLLLAGLIVVSSCTENKTASSNQAIDTMNLKRGEIVSCGPPEKEFGSVGFITSCSEKTKKDFNLALAMLHSFEYDEAEKAFAKVIDVEPQCAMAYWGVAMSNYHPLWSPPTQPELEKGAKAIAIAQSLGGKSNIESNYIDAIAQFYKDRSKVDHTTRSLAYTKAMENIYKQYPDNKEAAILYSLALTATADPADKTFANQKKAGGILTALYPEGPNHPGIVHYIIHTYDSPELATLALDAARKYASIAPSSAHAQHMPSHIFTRLGLWDECIKSNIVAASSAKCYAESTGLKGHWDEELHALDYLVYGYLQKGDNVSAKKQWDYVAAMKDVSPVNFKVLYAFAAIPSRYVLENKMWKEAANLQAHPAIYPWEKFPWQKATIHFTRLLGAANSSDMNAARVELKNLNSIYDTLIAQKNSYQANKVQIQVKTGEAWIKFKEGKQDEALQLMNLAADMEDKTEKSPVTPGEVIPARELLGDMLLQMGQTGKALEAYERDLKKHPYRFNGSYGAGQSAEKAGNKEKASFYYK